MTPSLVRVVELAQHDIAKARERFEDTFKRKQEAVAKVTAATAEFLRTGIADTRELGWIDVPLHGVGWGHKGFTWAAYFRRVAKEARRPFVSIENSGGFWNGSTWTWVPYVALTIERHGYTAPLAGMFLVLDKDVIGQEHNTKNYVFLFRNQRALDLLEDWRGACATERIMRRALRLV